MSSTRTIESTTKSLDFITLTKELQQHDGEITSRRFSSSNSANPAFTNTFKGRPLSSGNSETRPNTTYSSSYSNNPTIIETEVDHRSRQTDKTVPAFLSEEDDDIDYPDGGLEAWRVVFGSFLGLVCVFGLNNSIGAIHPYISIHQLANKSEIQVSLIFSMYLFLSTLLAGLVGPLYDTYGPRYLIISGTFLLTFGLFMTSLANAYYQFFLSFSLCCGVGCALLSTPIVSIIGQWFKAKRATAIGLATIGGNVGGVIFPIMLRKLYVTVGYAWAIRIWAFICLSLMVASFFLMKTRIEPTRNADPNSTFQYKWSEVVDLKSLKDLRFAFLVLYNVFAELAVFNGITYFASYALAQGVSESMSYALLTILNSTGIIGRWGTGVLADKWGRFNVLIITSVFAFVTAFAIWLPFHSQASMITFAVLHGFCNGGVFAGIPACVGQICRTRDYGKRYGTLYFCESFPILAGFPIAAALIKGTDYSGLISFTGALFVAATICLVFSSYCAVGFRLCKW